MKKIKWAYAVIMPIVIVVILEFLPINNLNTIPRLIISGLVGLIVSMVIFFIMRRYHN